MATTEQVWGWHDAMPEHLGAAVQLGASAGLRVAEACGLRISDVDFMRGVVSPAVQYPSEPLESGPSRTPVPIPAVIDAVMAARADNLRTVGGGANKSGRSAGL